MFLGSSEYDRDIVLAQNTNPERSSTPECRNARGTGTLRWHQLHAAADGTADVLARGDSWRGGALRPSHLAFSFAFLMQTKLPHAPCATLKPLRTTQDRCSTQRPHHRHMHVQWHLGALQNSTAQKWRHRPHVSAIAPPSVTSSSRMYHCLADATKAAVASEECASSPLTLTGTLHPSP